MTSYTIHGWLAYGSYHVRGVKVGFNYTIYANSPHSWSYSAEFSIFSLLTHWGRDVSYDYHRILFQISICFFFQRTDEKCQTLVQIIGSDNKCTQRKMMEYAFVIFQAYGMIHYIRCYDILLCYLIQYDIIQYNVVYAQSWPCTFEGMLRQLWKIMRALLFHGINFESKQRQLLILLLEIFIYIRWNYTEGWQYAICFFGNTSL